MHDADDGQEHRHEDRQHHVVHRDVAAQRNEAQQRAARHALQAVLTPCEGCLQPDEIDHLRHRQRDHREVDSLATNGDHANHRTDQTRAQRARQHAQLGAESRRADEIAREVGRGPEIGRVPERQQTGVAQQQIERAGENRIAQGLHHEDRVQADEGRGKQDRQAHQPCRARVTVQRGFGSRAHDRVPGKDRPSPSRGTGRGLAQTPTEQEPRNRLRRAVGGAPPGDGREKNCGLLMTGCRANTDRAGATEPASPGRRRSAAWGWARGELRPTHDRMSRKHRPSRSHGTGFAGP